MAITPGDSEGTVLAFSGTDNSSEITATGTTGHRTTDLHDSPEKPKNAELSSSSSDDEGSDSIHEMNRRQSLVQELARTYTQTSAIDVGSDPSSLFNNTDQDSPLNPNGHNFSARVWAKSISKLITNHGSGFRRTGFAFQNMNVYGYGNPTDYQKDVGNVWLQAPALARKLFTKTGGDTRIDILRDFDGVVKSGEMLVVLGPPGSGCTTFLSKSCHFSLLIMYLPQPRCMEWNVTD
jgi:hypothetical protein